MNSIAFHSYKGGTGKTTLSTNLAALLAARGYTVALMDVDFYAPSLMTYFKNDIVALPNKSINNFIFNKSEINEIISDMTPLLQNVNKNIEIKGKLFCGFASSKRNDIIFMDNKLNQEKAAIINRFIALQNTILMDINADYIIYDTSPGIKLATIGILALSEIVLITLKMDDLDIVGTKTLAEEVMEPFRSQGTIPHLLLNRTAGYCTPPFSHDSSSIISDNYSYNEIKEYLYSETKINVASSIPCYCDIQFKKREFLTVIEYPSHPFTEKIKELCHFLESQSNLQIQN